MSINYIPADLPLKDYSLNGSVSTVQENSDESIFTSKVEEFGKDFMAWTRDEDKVCTDGADDGKLSFKEGLASFGKGLVSLVKAPFQFADSVKNAVEVSKSPNASLGDKVKAWAGPALGVGIAAAATIATIATGGAAAVPILAGAGILGAGKLGYGAYKAITADSDGEAKKALETAGSGVTDVALTALAAGKVLTQAAQAGVYSANNASEMNTAQQFAQLYKSTPQALKVSSDILSGKTGGVLAGSQTFLTSSDNVGFELDMAANEGYAEWQHSGMDYNKANKMMDLFGVFSKEPLYAQNIVMDPTHEYRFTATHGTMHVYDTTAQENILYIVEHLANPIGDLGIATNATNGAIGAAEGALLVDQLNDLDKLN